MREDSTSGRTGNVGNRKWNSPRENCPGRYRELNVLPKWTPRRYMAPKVLVIVTLSFSTGDKVFFKGSGLQRNTKRDGIEFSDVLITTPPPPRTPTSE